MAYTLGQVCSKELAACQAEFDKLDIRRHGVLDKTTLLEFNAKRVAENKQRAPQLSDGAG